MRKRLRKRALIIIGLIYFSISYAQDTILVFHPTVSNIKMMMSLSDGIMWKENAQSFHFLGVYHNSERYDYQQSIVFLRENENLPFSLRVVNESLAPVTLYQENDCSEIFRELFNSSCGAVFLGGPDIPPITYNEPMNHLTYVSDPGRNYLELSAMFHFLGSERNIDFHPFLEDNPDYSILGICLGMQTMNVATGGTMIQDIPTEIYGYQTREDVLSNNEFSHRNYNYDSPLDSIYLTAYHFHPLMIKNKSSFSKTLKIDKNSKPFVLSAHHQCVKTLGQGLIPVAWSNDEKIIEAVIHEKYSGVTGIQFHPEKSGLFNSTEHVYVTTDSTINYKSYLIETGSEDFHRNFWKMIGENFVRNSTTPSQ
jgi:putative glutamine amidotransferase